MSKLAAIGAFALAISLIAVGCGSGGDQTAQPSKAQFVKKADAICAKSSEEIEAGFIDYVKENGSEELSEADYATLVETAMVPNVQREIDELRSLGAPSGDEDQVDAFLTALEESLEAAEADPKRVIAHGGRVYRKPNELAHEYGLSACGNP